ncbi:MAG: sugar ABC transporter permease [Clostridia bacterium]|nr:sugar ABC transporter permease [Clostridia bacterium]
MLSGLFRVILYLPTIVSGTVMAILYQYIVTDVYIGIASTFTDEVVLGLLDSSKTSEFLTILIFNVWVGFGANVMIYTGTMSGINESLVESAQLEGVNSLQELWYIYIPLIYPTLITFIVTGMTGIFTNQMSLFTFYGQTGSNFEVDVFGYYFYRLTQDASVNLYPQAKPMYSYPELSALGLIITLIVAPITLITRKLMEKYGPSVD